MHDGVEKMLPAAKKLYASYIKNRNKPVSEKSWQQGYSYEVTDLIDQLERLNERCPAFIIEDSLNLIKKSMYTVNKEEWLHISYLLYEELRECLVLDNSMNECHNE